MGIEWWRGEGFVVPAFIGCCFVLVSLVVLPFLSTSHLSLAGGGPLALALSLCAPVLWVVGKRKNRGDWWGEHTFLCVPVEYWSLVSACLIVLHCA